MRSSTRTATPEIDPVYAVGANLRAFGHLPVDTDHRAIGLAIDTTIDAIRHGLTRDAVIAAFDPLDALLAIDLGAFDALRAFGPALGLPLDALRTLGPALDLGAFDTLRALDPALGALDGLRAFGALGTFGADALASTVALHLSCTFALVVVVALSGGRGRNRQSGNASGEKYPGHDEILLLKPLERPAGRGVPGSARKTTHLGVLG